MMVQAYMDEIISLGLTVLAALGGSVVGIAWLIRWIANIVKTLKREKSDYEEKAKALETAADKLSELGGALERAEMELRDLRGIFDKVSEGDELIKAALDKIAGNIPHLVSNGVSDEIHRILGLNSSNVKVDEVKVDETEN